MKLDLFKAILKIQGVCKKLSSILLHLYVILGTWSLRIFTKEMIETRPPMLLSATRILNKCPNCGTEINHTPGSFKESIWLTYNQIKTLIYQMKREK